MQRHLWLVYALLSALSAGAVGIFGKVGLKDADTTAATAARAVVMAVLVCAFVAALGRWRQAQDLLTAPRSLGWLALSGAAGAISWICYFLALRAGKVSRVAPIDRLSVVFALLFAAIFLGERIGARTALGAGLMVLGALVLAWG